MEACESAFMNWFSFGSKIWGGLVDSLLDLSDICIFYNIKEYHAASEIYREGWGILVEHESKPGSPPPNPTPYTDATVSTHYCWCYIWITPNKTLRNRTTLGAIWYYQVNTQRHSCLDLNDDWLKKQ